MSVPAGQVAATTFNPRENGSDYFWYQAAVAGLSTAAPAQNAIINLDADSDFYCVALTTISDIAGAAYTESTQPVNLCKVLITDTGSGKALSNGPLTIGAMTGDGKRPYRFVRPRVFIANATIQLAFSIGNQAAGTTYNIQIIFHGYKVYR
jgi:hypothetical protein